MEEPQEVAGEEYERVWEWVAAVDVAKASGVVRTRVPANAARRLARQRGKRKALAAATRSILIIIFHLLADRGARFRDLGSATTTFTWTSSARSATTSASSRPSA